MSKNKSDHRTRKSQTQSPQEAVDLEEAANNVVRYFICQSGSRLIVSKSELNRNILHKARRNYDEIMIKAQDILRNVYGYKLMLCNTAKGKDKHYILSNILPYMKDPSETEENHDIHKVLMLLVLSHIFMANNNVSEDSLYAFLKNCGIDVTVKHPLFGQVKDYINKTMVREQYVLLEIDNVTRIPTFKWGMRAEKEISKMAVLKFVCEMYKNNKPENWIGQYKMAKEQPYENHELSSSTQEG